MTVQLIRLLAKNMAGSFFEGQTQFIRGELHQHPDSPGRSERFRKLAGHQKKFISEHWTEFVPAARKQLIEMLAMPQYNAHIKAEIYDALLSDQKLLNDEDEARIFPWAMQPVEMSQ